MAGGGWKTSKQFLEHDNYASCFSSGEMAKQKLTKFQEEKKKKRSPVGSEQAWKIPAQRVSWRMLQIAETQAGHNDASVWSL